MSSRDRHLRIVVFSGPSRYLSYHPFLACFALVAARLRMD